MPILRMVMYPCRLVPGVPASVVRDPFALDRVAAVLDGQDGESLSAEDTRAAIPLDLVLCARAKEMFRMPVSSALSVSYEQAFDDDDEPIFHEDGSPQLVRVHGLRMLTRVLFADKIDLRIEGAMPTGWDLTLLLKGTAMTEGTD